MENTLYRLNEDRVLFTELDDEAVIYDMENDQYFELNATLATILKHVQNNLNFSEIVLNLMKEYEVDQHICEQQLAVSLDELLSREFIYVEDISGN